jgi:DNA-binding response OmpR family regulator
LTAAGNLLIVEDDPEWCEIYAHIAEREGMRMVKVAKDLAEAAALIDDMQFAIAFIDIGLDVAADRNIDGLRVMDKIRSWHDETSIVVVTGRSGRDVIPITRDSIMRYAAHDIMAKADITPQKIKELLRSGRAAFQEKASRAATPPQEVLKGNLEAWDWEDRMIKGTGIQGGVQSLYDFLGQLVAEFLPLAAGPDGGPVAQDPATGVMHGSYWSRSAGAPVVICFGAGEQARPEIASAKSARSLLGVYPVGTVLTEKSAHGVTGAVFALDGARRESFATA